MNTGVLVLPGLVFVVMAGATGMASARSCYKLLPCPADPIPDGSKDGCTPGQLGMVATSVW